MEPLISIMLQDNCRQYQPGDELTCQYQIDAVAASELQAVEASILWYTEGKGDEDMSIAYFERRVPTEAENGDLRPMREFAMHLPNSPLSYDGAILKIRWCARVRVFLGRGKETSLDIPFQLGSVPRGKALSKRRKSKRPENADDESHDETETAAAS